MIEGTAASRSTRAAAGRASHGGEYCVRKRATQIDRGTEITRATSEEATVVQASWRMPKAIGSLVCHWREVRKFALSAARAGRAWAMRKAAMSATSATTSRPAPVANPRKTRSPARPV